MNRRTLIPGVILVLAAVAAYVAVPAAQRPGGLMHVELYIYKNGKLVLYDPDDPAVDNMGKIIAELIAPEQNFNIISRDGYSYSFIDTTYEVDRNGIIEITDGQDVFTRSMNALPNGSHSYTAEPSVTLSSDDNGVYVTVSASFTPSAPINVTWVGLYANWDTGWGSYKDVDRYFLLFADRIETVSIESGDTITVVYKITLP